MAGAKNNADGISFVEIQDGMLETPDESLDVAELEDGHTGSTEELRDVESYNNEFRDLQSGATSTSRPSTGSACSPTMPAPRKLSMAMEIPRLNSREIIPGIMSLKSSPAVRVHPVLR